MIRVFDFNNDNKWVCEEMVKLFGKKAVHYDKNLVEVGTSMEEFAKVYTGACFLRYYNHPNLVGISKKGTCKQS